MHTNNRVMIHVTCFVLLLPQDKYGATPLIVACGENHLEVVKFLTDHGADINLQTKVIICSHYFHHLLIIARGYLTIGWRLLTTPLCQSEWIHSCSESVGSLRSTGGDEK